MKVERSVDLGQKGELLVVKRCFRALRSSGRTVCQRSDSGHRRAQQVHGCPFRRIDAESAF